MTWAEIAVSKNHNQRSVSKRTTESGFYRGFIGLILDISPTQKPLTSQQPRRLLGHGEAH